MDMRHRRPSVLLAGLSVVVVVLITGVAVTVVRHMNSDHQREDLATVRRFATAVTVGDAHRSHGCTVSGISCWSTSLSVQATTRSVTTSLHGVSGRDPQVRCFPHQVGALGVIVNSCNVDVEVGTHSAYAFINPVITGPLRDQRAVGATVSINAD
jgi:hypothetical protein